MSPVSAELVVLWAAWFLPFALYTPRRPRRASVTVSGPTYAGLLLECLSVFLAFWLRLPAGAPRGIARVAASLICGALAIVLSWTATRHLGRQLRVRAGLYPDHELVRSGPYTIVRHPIYASLLAMLLSTMVLVTPWRWMPLPLAVFVLGTEIRVRCEDKLLASRFGEEFQKYRSSVPAYVPWLR